MRYLREAGKEFAQAFPDRARMLNIDRIERDLTSSGCSRVLHS
jgi:type VI secretion system protein ImpG